MKNDMPAGSIISNGSKRVEVIDANASASKLKYLNQTSIPTLSITFPISLKPAEPQTEKIVAEAHPYQDKDTFGARFIVKI